MATEVRNTVWITDGMWSCCTTLRDCTFILDIGTVLEWSCQQHCGSGLTTSIPVSDVFTPYTNGVWLFCSLWVWCRRTDHWPCVPSIDLIIQCMAWWFWMTRQLVGCSSHVPRSSAAQQWTRTCSNDEEDCNKDWSHQEIFIVACYHGMKLCNCCLGPLLATTVFNFGRSTILQHASVLLFQKQICWIIHFCKTFLSWTNVSVG